MGYHADDEKELGYQPIIAALSLGATRKFVFKHKKTQDKVELYLGVWSSYRYAWRYSDLLETHYHQD